MAARVGVIEIVTGAGGVDDLEFEGELEHPQTKDSASNAKTDSKRGLFDKLPPKRQWIS